MDAGRKRKMAAIAAGAIVGAGLLLARGELGNLGVIVGAAAIAALVLLAGGLTWGVRRLLKRRRHVLPRYAAGGLIVGLIMDGGVSLIAGGGIGHALECRRQIKEGLLRPATHGPAHLDIVEGVPVLHMYGTPEEMGEQYGALAKTALQGMYGFGRWAMPKAVYARLERAAKRHEALLSDDYRSELAATARAAGIPYEALLTANLTVKVGCTVLIAWGSATKDGSMLFARNGEYFSFGNGDRGSLITVWHPTTGRPQLSLNYLGMIGAFSGINDAGLSFGNLEVFNARDDTVNAEALPIHIVLRDAAGHLGTADELRDYLLKMPPVKPYLVALADAKNGYIVELGMKSAGVRPPTRDYVAAGNFFLDADRRRGAPRPWFQHRYDHLIEFANAQHGQIDAANITEALYAARAPKMFSMQAMVFDPSRMTIYASCNRTTPASAGPYARLDVRALLAAPPVTLRAAG